MMTLTHWLQHLPADHVIYALIDPLADNQPLHYWYRHASDTEAWPLYGGTEFTDAILHGPWLLPLAQLADWQTWWQEQERAGQAQGVLIASPYLVEQLVRHWQNLLIAGLDGEEVLFRYYDPRVLAPMLATYTETEICQFLGPTTSLLIWHQADWRVYSPYPKAALTEHTEPWWRMRPAHFAGQPGEKETCLTNIAQWLWQQVPELTTQQYEKFGDIRQALDVHYDELSKKSIPELWLPSVLILYLFGFRDWWPGIQNVVVLPPEAEQTDVIHKIIALIEKYQQSKMREDDGQ
nr:DUF4123 domain-containing protein [uncultured Tolumonas sp.]